MPRRLPSDKMKSDRLKDDRHAAENTKKNREAHQAQRETFINALRENSAELEAEGAKPAKLEEVSERMLETRAAFADATRGALLCMKIGRENRIKDDAELKARTDGFFMSCARCQIKPTMENYALALGYSLHWVEQVINGNQLGFTVNTRPILEGAQLMIRGIISELALGGQVDKVYAIFYQKNNGGMVDEKRLTVAAEVNQKTPEQLLHEAALLADDNPIPCEYEEKNDG